MRIVVHLWTELNPAISAKVLLAGGHLRVGAEVAEHVPRVGDSFRSTCNRVSLWSEFVSPR